MCQFYRSGNCKYGSECNFSHSPRNGSRRRTIAADTDRESLGSVSLNSPSDGHVTTSGSDHETTSGSDDNSNSHGSSDNNMQYKSLTFPHMGMIDGMSSAFEHKLDDAGNNVSPTTTSNTSFDDDDGDLSPRQNFSNNNRASPHQSYLVAQNSPKDSMKATISTDGAFMGTLEMHNAMHVRGIDLEDTNFVGSVNSDMDINLSYFPSNNRLTPISTPVGTPIMSPTENTPVRGVCELENTSNSLRNTPQFLTASPVGLSNAVSCQESKPTIVYPDNNSVFNMNMQQQHQQNNSNSNNSSSVLGNPRRSRTSGFSSINDNQSFNAAAVMHNGNNSMVMNYNNGNNSNSSSDNSPPTVLNQFARGPPPESSINSRKGNPENGSQSSPRPRLNSSEKAIVTPLLEKIVHHLDLTCGICQSEPGNGVYGILSHCNCAFCLKCIRGWRKDRDGGAAVVGNENKVDSGVRKCPLCRQESYFTIPSNKPFALTKQKQEEELGRHKAYVSTLYRYEELQRQINDAKVGHLTPTMPSIEAMASELAHLHLSLDHLGQDKEDLLEALAEAKRSFILNYKHNLAKIPCRNVLQGGGCQFGSSCFYMHDLSNNGGGQHRGGGGGGGRESHHRGGHRPPTARSTAWKMGYSNNNKR